MDDWQEKALELLPGMEDEIFEVSSPMTLWIEIGLEFRQAYHEPKNEDLIRRVYEFSRWCVEHEQGMSAADDLPTAVAVCFYEHLPTWDGAREDMPRWFTLEEIEHMHQLLSYHQTAEEFAQLKAMFTPAEKISRKKRKRKSKGITITAPDA